MLGSRRRVATGVNVWPGYVDALRHRGPPLGCDTILPGLIVERNPSGREGAPRIEVQWTRLAVGVHGKGTII